MALQSPTRRGMRPPPISVGSPVARASRTVIRSSPSPLASHGDIDGDSEGFDVALATSSKALYRRSSSGIDGSASTSNAHVANRQVDPSLSPKRAAPPRMIIMPTSSGGLQWVSANTTQRPANNRPPELTFHLENRGGSPSPSISQHSDPETDDDVRDCDGDREYPAHRRPRAWTYYPTSPVYSTKDKARSAGTVPRIGIDIGGVLTREGDPEYMGSLEEWDSTWEAEGAFDACRKIARVFGPENTFLVSKVKPGGSMHRRIEQWLHETCNFCELTNIPKDNIVFVSAIDGPEGKGVVSAQLGLSHFVDDKSEVLKSIWEDEAGNARHLVERHNGLLFHFAKGGWGKTLPPVDAGDLAPMMRRHYHPVANWEELLERLREKLPAPLLKHSAELTKTESRSDAVAFAAGSSAARAQREPPPWGRHAQRVSTLPPASVSSPTAARASSALPAGSDISSSRGAAALQWTASGRPKLVLKPRSAPQAVTQAVSAATSPTAAVRTQSARPPRESIPHLHQEPSTTANVVSPTVSAAASPTAAMRTQSARPPRDQEPVTTVLAAPAPAGPAMRRDPAGGRPRLVLKKREGMTPPVAPAPVPAHAPAAAPAVPNGTLRPPSACTETACRGRSSDVRDTGNGSLRAPQPEPRAPQSAEPALRRDPAGGRPKLMLKPRTVTTSNS